MTNTTKEELIPLLKEADIAVGGALMEKRMALIKSGSQIKNLNPFEARTVSLNAIADYLLEHGVVILPKNEAGGEK